MEPAPVAKDLELVSDDARGVRTSYLTSTTPGFSNPAWKKDRVRGGLRESSPFRSGPLDGVRATRIGRSGSRPCTMLTKPCLLILSVGCISIRFLFPQSPHHSLVISTSFPYAILTITGRHVLARRSRQGALLVLASVHRSLTSQGRGAGIRNPQSDATWSPPCSSPGQHHDQQLQHSSCLTPHSPQHKT